MASLFGHGGLSGFLLLSSRFLSSLLGGEGLILPCCHGSFPIRPLLPCFLLSSLASLFGHGGLLGLLTRCYLSCQGFVLPCHGGFLICCLLSCGILSVLASLFSHRCLLSRQRFVSLGNGGLLIGHLLSGVLTRCRRRIDSSLPGSQRLILTSHGGLRIRRLLPCGILSVLSSLFGYRGLLGFLPRRRRRRCRLPGVQGIILKLHGGESFLGGFYRLLGGNGNGLLAFCFYFLAGHFSCLCLTTGIRFLLGDGSLPSSFPLMAGSDQLLGFQCFLGRHRRLTRRFSLLGSLGCLRLLAFEIFALLG